MSTAARSVRPAPFLVAKRTARYLSDVDEGGETNFPRAGGLTGPVDLRSCALGLNVKPARGKVAMFYSLTPDGQLDDFSLHGACPVVAGVKSAANKWVWNRPGAF